MSDGKRVTIREPEECIELMETYMGLDIAKFMRSAVNDMRGDIEILESEASELERDIERCDNSNLNILRGVLAALNECAKKIELAETTIDEIKEAIAEIKREIDSEIW